MIQHSFLSLIVLSLIFKISRVDYLGRAHLFGTSFKLHRGYKWNSRLQRKCNVPSTTLPPCVRIFFFCIFCISLILNTVLTAVYIDLNSFSYGRYKEAKCRIQYIRVSSSFWMLPLQEKTSRLKIFSFTLLGRYNQILILVFWLCFTCHRFLLPFFPIFTLKSKLQIVFFVRIRDESISLNFQIIRA